jgi:DNA-binding NarL/FixJ family response regulator
MIGQSKVLPDVCIVDLNMPVLNGLDTIIELNSRFTGIGILVFTAFDMKEYFLRMMEAGANGYLVKTCSIEELVEAIVSIHKSEFYCPDSYTKQLFARVRKQESLTVKLTEMEYQVLKMCCSDLPYKEMAKLLKVSEASIEGYRASLFRKLNLNSRTQLAIYAIKTGLYPLYYDESSNIVK